MARYRLECFECHTPQAFDNQSFRCNECGGLLEVVFDLSNTRPRWDSRPLSVWKYREVLPIDREDAIVTLGEGGTGLHHCQRLGKRLGLKNLYVKNEGENPTGSFKDRGMTVAISKAVEQGKTKVVCASTGNTAASLAAYAARAGLHCIVFVPRGRVAPGKMVQVVVHGALIVEVNGDFDRAFEVVVSLSGQNSDLYLMNSVNPYRLEGQKTMAFEVYDQLDGHAPDVFMLPVGNGGNISASWKGFTELRTLGFLRHRPRMVGIQATHAAPIVKAVKAKKSKIRPVSKPETIATAIRIGSPVNWTKVLGAIDESDGTAETVTDSQILRAQQMLAREEGIFVEPASAASIAGLEKIVNSGGIDRTDTVVCVTTGHGLKDPSIIKKMPVSKQMVRLGGSDPESLARLTERLR